MGYPAAFSIVQKEGEGLENMAKISIAIVGSCASYLWGGWSALLDVLFVLIVVDYISGVIASATEGKLSSKVGMIGIAKKVFIFLLVTAAHKIDVVLGNGHMFRDGVIFFYMVNELLSITENGGRMGLPIPPILSKAIEVIKAKGGGQDASKDTE